MDNFMEMTKKAGHKPELLRLIDLHAVYDDGMGGKLVLAPVDLEEPGKRILDAGTADGTWLRGLRSKLSAQHHYFGSDIEPELFPEQPDGITYFQQSFNDPWADELKSSFDLVHVRASLAGSAPKGPYQAVRGLASLAKAGGWVQLVEMNAFSPLSNGPAMTDFTSMVKQAWTGIGVGNLANELRATLEAAGLQNVQEKRLIFEMGKMAKPELAASSVNGITAAVAPLASVASSVRTSFSEDQLSALPGRVRAELENQGGRVEAIVAWGQRV